VTAHETCFDRVTLADEYIAVQRREAVLAVLEQLRVEVEAEQPCTCNPAYGRILGPEGEHALECVGRTSLRNGIRHLIDTAIEKARG
jgi:hypothetical protein